VQEDFDAPTVSVYKMKITNARCSKTNVTK